MRRTEPDRGWAWVILFASFSGNCLAGFCMYAVGLFHVALLEKFQESVTLTSWISSVFLCLLSLSGPLASFLIERWSCRVTVILGSVVMSVGLTGTAFSNNIFMALVFLGLVSGIGIGLIFNAGYIILAFNFEQKRNLATGISVSGCGIGPFILSPIYQRVYMEYGYNGFFLLFAGLTLQICVCGMLMRPSKLELSTKVSNRRHENDNRQCCNCDKSILKNVPVLLVGIGGLVFNIGIFIIYLHFPEYALHHSATGTEISWLFSISGVCSSVGRVLLGLATNSETVDENLVFFGSYVFLGICTLLFPVFVSISSVRVLYMTILGFYSGACYVVLNTILFKIVGPQHVAQGTGYVLAYIGIGSLIGPPLGGAIVDNGGTYDTSFVVAGACLILGGCCQISNVIFRKEIYQKPSVDDLEIDVTFAAFEVGYSNDKHTNLENGESQSLCSS